MPTDATDYPVLEREPTAQRVKLQREAWPISAHADWYNTLDMRYTCAAEPGGLNFRVLLNFTCDATLIALHEALGNYKAERVQTIAKLFAR